MLSWGRRSEIVCEAELYSHHVPRSHGCTPAGVLSKRTRRHAELVRTHAPPTPWTHLNASRKKGAVLSGSDAPWCTTRMPGRSLRTNQASRVIRQIGRTIVGLGINKHLFIFGTRLTRGSAREDDVARAALALVLVATMLASHHLICALSAPWAARVLQGTRRTWGGRRRPNGRVKRSNATTAHVGTTGGWLRRWLCRARHRGPRGHVVRHGRRARHRGHDVKQHSHHLRNRLRRALIHHTTTFREIPTQTETHNMLLWSLLVYRPPRPGPAPGGGSKEASRWPGRSRNHTTR